VAFLKNIDMIDVNGCHFREVVTMTEAEMIQCAMDECFAAAAIVDTTQIVFDPSFRPYCEENLCGQYGANYSCPPDCGSPEEMKRPPLSTVIMC
jgi:predicted metal-binding protein